MSLTRKHYPFSEFEPRWQHHWLETGAFRAANPGDPDFRPEAPKFYVLDMFPYPSGDGLHVGHVEGYTATDILARHRRMTGANVLHPMGWDAFGLPAEQYAIKTGQHPRVTTQRNVDNFRKQLQELGFSYDWSREISTTDPEYFRWTQWIFLQLYNAWVNPATNRAEPISTYTGDDPGSVRLAYVSEVPVNWCPELGTVLANEEVVDGKSEVGGFPVERRPMRQWMLRITAYAERLMADLEGLDWPESIKILQRNWIGRSEGAEVCFGLRGPHGNGHRLHDAARYALRGHLPRARPEHPLVGKITTAGRREAVEAYVKAVNAKSDLERTDLAKEKTGVFTGASAINPVNGQKIPVWIADYVLTGYGTGAIMAVPAHDERDHEFAVKFSLHRRGRPAGRTYARVLFWRRHRLQFRSHRRTPHSRGEKEDHLMARGKGPRQGNDHLQAPRLALLPPALLGRAFSRRLGKREAPSPPRVGSSRGTARHGRFQADRNGRTTRSRRPRSGCVTRRPRRVS